MNTSTFVKPCSVIIPFYNGNKYLAEALASVSINTDQVEEIIIVVDYGSEAPVFDVLNLKVRVLNNTSSINRGAGFARALGYNAAVTKFVAFLDCDDVWGVEKLKQHLALAIECDLAFSFHNFYHFDNSCYSSEIVCNGPYTLQAFFRKKFTIGCLTVLLDKETLGSLEGNSLKRRNDYYMWFQVIKKCELRNLDWGGINIKASAGHRLHDNSLSSSKLKTSFSQFYFYLACDLGVFHAFFFFFLYVINTLKTRSTKYYRISTPKNKNGFD